MRLAARLRCFGRVHLAASECPSFRSSGSALSAGLFSLSIPYCILCSSVLG